MDGDCWWMGVITQRRAVPGSISFGDSPPRTPGASADWSGAAECRPRRERERGGERERERELLDHRGEILNSFLTLIVEVLIGLLSWRIFFLSFSGGKVLSLMHQHCGPPVTDPFKLYSVPRISYISLKQNKGVKERETKTLGKKERKKE